MSHLTYFSSSFSCRCLSSVLKVHLFYVIILIQNYCNPFSTTLCFPRIHKATRCCRLELWSLFTPISDSFRFVSVFVISKVLNKSLATWTKPIGSISDVHLCSITPINLYRISWKRILKPIPLYSVQPLVFNNRSG